MIKNKAIFKFLKLLISFATGLFISIICATFFYLSISVNVKYLPIIEEISPILYKKKELITKGLLSLILILSIISIISIIFFLKKRKKLIGALRIELDTVGIFHPILLAFGALLIAWVIPALIIIWLINPTQYKNAIRVAVVFLSGGIGIIYFIKRRRKFPTAAEKITYFMGIIFGPAGLLEILFLF